VSDVRQVRLRDESIRLGQFLKLADLVDTGADAKGVLAAGLVRVNGEVESRRGRQLADGDVVELSGRRVVVSTGSGGGVSPTGG
jgi:ribosome-associated protein